MHITIKSGQLSKQTTECLVLFSGSQAGQLTTQVDPAVDKQLASLLARGDLGPSVGDSLLVHSPQGGKAERILLVNRGDKPLTDGKTEQLFTALSGALGRSRVCEATIAFEGLEVQDHDQRWTVRQLSRHLVAGTYRFTEYKSTQSDALSPPALAKVALLQSGRKALEEHRKAVCEGVAIADGMAVARDLGNHPGNVCTPKYLTDVAKKMAKGNPRLSVKALGEKEMEKLGMGAFLSVSKGSTEQGQLIQIEYKGGKAKERPVVLVGKGVTFDSGGISLKPGPGMDEMKYDMGGAASVMGAIKSIADLELPVNVVALIAAAENMPAGNASKPGDIVTTLAGKTVEILNTDAEGRLVLCDTLTYAERFKPKVVVDVATLTGACVIALGHSFSGLISNSDTVAEALLAAGSDACDSAWRLPLDENSKELLSSPFADMANVGGRPGGTLTAGYFLSCFAEKYPWAHLDIAGTAWNSGHKKGATGRPVPLLVQFVLNCIESPESITSN